MTEHVTIFCQVYTMKQEKRELCPYDKKRYLLADLPDGRSNPTTNAYGNCDLAAEKHLVADQLDPGAKFIIRPSKKQFDRRHARVTRRLELGLAIEIKEELPDGTPTASFIGANF